MRKLFIYVLSFLIISLPILSSAKPMAVPSPVTLAGDGSLIVNGLSLTLGYVPQHSDTTARDAFWDGDPATPVNGYSICVTNGQLQIYTGGAWTNASGFIKGDTGDAGAAGADGADGADGANAYVYIAYASDASGTGFTTTFSASLAYIAVLATDTEIPTPQASDFTGLWIKYKGDDGAGSGDMTKAVYDQGDDGVIDPAAAPTLPNMLGYLTITQLPALAEGYIWVGDATGRPAATSVLNISGIQEAVPILDGDATGQWGWSGNATASRTIYLGDFDSEIPAATAVDSNGLILVAGLAPDADDDAIEFFIDGGGTAVTAGLKGCVEVPFACTINSSTLVADQTGSIVLDIWVDTFGNYQPTVADTITASAKPTLSSAISAQDATLTGWTTSLSKGDWICWNVDSASTVTWAINSLKVDK